MKKNSSIDPYTGQEFEKRRANQRFANTKNKNAYHNENARKERNKISTVQKALMTNRKILDKLLGKNIEISVSQEFLRGAGVYINFFTQWDRENQIIHIFEFEISKANDKLIIKRSKNYE